MAWPYWLPGDDSASIPTTDAERRARADARAWLDAESDRFGVPRGVQPMGRLIAGRWEPATREEMQAWAEHAMRSQGNVAGPWHAGDGPSIWGAFTGAIGDLARVGATGLEAAAPIAEAVLAMVPGAGTVAAALTAAAIALAEGHSISDVTLAAARAAVPGGALGQMAFDAGVALYRGGNLTDAGLAALRGQYGGAADLFTAAKAGAVLAAAQARGAASADPFLAARDAKVAADKPRVAGLAFAASKPKSSSSGGGFAVIAGLALMAGLALAKARL